MNKAQEEIKNKVVERLSNEHEIDGDDPDVSIFKAIEYTIEETKKEYEQTQNTSVDLLRLAGCLEKVDDDVVKLTISLLPKKGESISLKNIMMGIQKIKDNFTKVSKFSEIDVKDIVYEHDKQVKEKLQKKILCWTPFLNRDKTIMCREQVLSIISEVLKWK